VGFESDGKRSKAGVGLGTRRDYEEDEEQMSKEAFELPESLFPLNPEMSLLEEQSQTLFEEENDQPLLAMNPKGTFLINEDKDKAMEPLEWESEPRMSPVTWFATAPGQEVWDSTDYRMLMYVINETRTEKIGARPLLHLNVWERTCGGREFMAEGLTEKWTDTVKVPEALRKAK
jgi:hypothetical protein